MYGKRCSRDRGPDCQSKGRWFNPTYRRFETSFSPLCLRLSEETLKASGPFYLVSMPGEVKYPTQGVNLEPVGGLNNSREEQLLR